MCFSDIVKICCQKLLSSNEENTETYEYKYYPLYPRFLFKGRIRFLYRKNQILLYSLF